MSGKALRRIPAITAITAIILLGSPAIADDSVRPGYLADAADILVPADYSPSNSYPLVVLLPYTTGTSHEFYQRYVPLVQNTDIIYLLPQGRPQRTHYLPHFTQYVEWYEDQLFEDLLMALETYSIDHSQIILAGYSLGGDLSWALLVRNADVFTGAVVMGSRTSYAVSPESLASLERREVRVSFTIGRNEAPERYNGINRSRELIASANVATRYAEIDGGHWNPPAAAFADALEWVMESRASKYEATDLR